ncbi:MAG: pyridoxamine 5'-phosphate oxidase family protein [Clostridia bacterium]|nr:pyridoxamine 5'-phosphate oxidase family protein [Clostridia bacterium]
MFREMRRKNQLLTDEECIEILNSSTSGTLALLGDNDYPYSLPISYVYNDGKLYFHSALTGHKIDAINMHSKASFCVIAQDKVVPEKYTTYFRSVIAFGKICVIDNDAEKLRAIEILAEKYSPQLAEGRKKEIEDNFSRMCMIELDIEHMTGKEAKELACMKME